MDKYAQMKAALSNNAEEMSDKLREMMDKDINELRTKVNKKVNCTIVYNIYHEHGAHTIKIVTHF